MDAALTPKPESNLSTKVIEQPAIPSETAPGTPGTLPKGDQSAPMPTTVQPASDPVAITPITPTHALEPPEPDGNPDATPMQPAAAPCQDAPSRPLPRLTKVWADGAYAGSLEEWMRDKYNIDLEIIRRPDEGGRNMWVAPGQAPTPRDGGFKLLPHRWIVERSLGWLGRSRRLSRDYEQRTDVSESWILTAMGRLMLRRLVRAPTPAQPAVG